MPGCGVLLFALGPDSVHAAVISTFSAIDNSLLDDIRGDAKRKDFVSPGSVELRTPFKNLSEHFQGATEPGYPQNRTLSDSYPNGGATVGISYTGQDSISSHINLNGAGYGMSALESEIFYESLSGGTMIVEFDWVWSVIHELGSADPEDLPVFSSITLEIFQSGTTTPLYTNNRTIEAGDYFGRFTGLTEVLSVPVTAGEQGSLLFRLQIDTDTRIAAIPVTNESGLFLSGVLVIAMIAIGGSGQRESQTAQAAPEKPISGKLN